MALWEISHVLTAQDRLSKAFNDDYAEALANQWSPELVMERPGEGNVDRFEWLLTSASIQALDKGSMIYEDLVTQATSIEHADFGDGIKISRNQFEDDKFSFAGDRAAQLGSSVALHPQNMAISLIKNGGTGKAYDGKTFFATDHPVNPFDTAAGTFANVATSFALTAVNFSDAVGRMQSFKMPNGQARNVKVTHLCVPPALRKTALEITSAEFLGQSSGGTNENVLKHYGVKSLVIPELAGADTVWYLVGQMSGTFGRPFGYSRRRAFEMTSYDGMSNAELGRLNQLEWQLRGRAQGFYGHPFLAYKATA